MNQIAPLMADFFPLNPTLTLKFLLMFLPSAVRIRECNCIHEFLLSSLWLIIAMQKTPLLRSGTHSHIVQLDFLIVLFYRRNKKGMETK